MIWILIRQFGFFAFVILTIWFVSQKKYEHLLWLYFFTFPFQNCAQYLIVTVWNPYKIVALGMAWVILFHHNARHYPPELTKLFRFFILMLVFSTLFSIAQPPQTSSYDNILMRLIVQDFTYLLGFVPLLFMKWLPLDFGERVWRWYTYAIIVLLIIGIIHFCFIQLGIPFSPIIRDFGITNESAGAMFGDNVIKRIYGFCGEPKNMAFAVTPFLICLLIHMISYKVFTKKALALVCITFFVFINTYSSAAYIEFVLGLIGSYIIVKYYQSKMNSIILIVFVGLIITFSISCYIDYSATHPILSNEMSSHSFVDNFYDRSFGRAKGEIEEGRSETLVMDTWLNSGNLIYYIFGFGPGLYSFHCGLTFSRGFLPVQSGLVLNLVDFGIMGYFFFFYLINWALSIANKVDFSSYTISVRFLIIAGCVLIGNMMYSMMGGAIVIGMLPYLAIPYWINENSKYNQNTVTNRTHDYYIAHESISHRHS